MNITPNQMNFEAGVSQLDFSTYEKRIHCTITSTRRRFSSSPAKYEGSEFDDYVIDNGNLDSYFKPKFYANGDCAENEGHVSVLFHGTNVTALLICSVNIEINFTVSVIDVAGNKRFRQTSSYASDVSSSSDLQDHFPKFGLDRYLKRETLCNEPEELLPGDCLTVYLEVDFVVHFELGDIERFVAKETVSRNDLLFLKLDSTFGRELREVSEFFQFASDTPMKESRTRLVHVPVREIKALYRIHLILEGAKAVEFDSVENVCEMYTVADKYCIRSVVETSRQIIKSFLCRINDKTIEEHVVESIPVLLLLAEKHGDESLKRTISVYSEIKKKLETTEFVYAYEEQLKEELETDWICKRIRYATCYTYSLCRMRENFKELGMEFYK